MNSRVESALDDPAIDLLWVEAAELLGLRVERTTSAYASTDGQGVISIGARETLDPDDSLAQLVFHELCHALVQGPECQSLRDWGLDNTTGRDLVREHACLCLQAALAARWGLREPMAPTTEYRAYYDALPADPLGGCVDDESFVEHFVGPQPGAADAVRLARLARERWLTSPWRRPVDDALRRTAELTAQRGLPPSHPVGLPWGPDGETCGTCAWRYSGGRGRAVDRCRQAAPAAGDGPRTDPQLRACVRWEPPLDCRACGACCREAYHSVTVAVRDPVVWKHPDLIMRRGHRFEILREGDRCAALQGRGSAAEPYTCVVYEDRPRPCREFEKGGRHCLEARRRVGY